MYCPKCGSANENTAQFCPHCGAALSQSTQQPNVVPQQNAPEQAPVLKMGWFKFLIYFSLFAGAILNIYTAISLLTGTAYGDSKDLVYAVFEDLKTLDMIIGLASLALAALGIYTRFRLSGYRSNGPKLLQWTLMLSVLINVGYLVGLNVVVPEIAEELELSSFVSSITTSIVMIFVNNAYFKKRSHLFVK